MKNQECLSTIKRRGYKIHRVHRKGTGKSSRRDNKMHSAERKVTDTAVVNIIDVYYTSAPFYDTFQHI